MTEDDRARGAFSLAGELAIVTGGGTGLGFAMASCLAATGARVVITGRRVAVLEEAAKKLGPSVTSERFDVTDFGAAPEFIAKVEERYGTATILINNAGIHVKKAIEEHTVEDFHRVLATHVEGAFALTRAAVPGMKRAGHGSILFIASMSSFIGMPGIVGYSAAKSAYLGMMRSMAAELGASNIRVNAIAPGWIETPMLRQALDGDPKRKQKILDRTPEHRFGSPEDIGWAAVFLCSPAASFINGVVLPVDGGASIGF
ncbi:MAG TPA: glucose 1-dehydrogenase [Terracidiphilus sp.]|nr:glucose 1-dehydrogenase [Terracidiphilus sp.]